VKGGEYDRNTSCNCIICKSFTSFSCPIFISRISMLNKSGKSKHLLGPDLQRKAFINNDAERIPRWRLEVGSRK
jgi:hypothetical protein